MAVGGGEYVLADGIASRPARWSVRGASSPPYSRIRQLLGLGSPGSPPIGRIRAANWVYLNRGKKGLDLFC
jgi:hypothetical protein